MALPTFIIIGAAKSGTSSIYRYLQQHPNVCMSHTKETNFFAYGDSFVHENWPNLLFPVQSIEEYQGQFEPGPDDIAIGEASPIYFDSPAAAKNISNTVPDVKIIVSLRNPVDRAISGYFMHIREGDAANDFSNFDFEHRYVSGGYYTEKLQRYIDEFGIDRIRIVLFDDLKKDATAFMKNFYEHIGVSTEFDPQVRQVHNPGRVPKNQALNRVLTNPGLRHKISPMIPRPLRQAAKWLLEKNRTKLPEFPDTLRRELQDHYKDEVSRLQELTGLDLEHWR